MESCVNWDGPVSMVPCVHQENIYTNRKLRVWRDQKCIPLVGAKTLVTCAGLQNTPSRGRQYRGPRTESWINWDGHMAMVPGLHQGNIYTKRKLRVWREQKCIPLVGALHQGNIYSKKKVRVWRDQKRIPFVCAINTFTCAGRHNTPSRGRKYRAQKGKFGKLGRTYGDGTVFAPRKY